MHAAQAKMPLLSCAGVSAGEHAASERAVSMRCGRGTLDGSSALIGGGLALGALSRVFSTCLAMHGPRPPAIPGHWWRWIMSRVTSPACRRGQSLMPRTRASRTAAERHSAVMCRPWVAETRAKNRACVCAVEEPCLLARSQGSPDPGQARGWRRILRMFTVLDTIKIEVKHIGRSII